MIGVFVDQGKSDVSWGATFFDALRQRNVDAFAVTRKDVQQGAAVEMAANATGFLWRFTHVMTNQWLAKPFLASLEHGKRIAVWPNHDTRWHYDNKAAQAWLLQSIRAPIADTYACVELHASMDWARHARYPQVFKLASGASAGSVCLVKTFDEAARLIDRVFCRGLTPLHALEDVASGKLPSRWSRLLALPYNLARECWHTWHYGDAHRFEPRVPLRVPTELQLVVFQQFLPNNSYDYRITVIGDRAFGFRRFNRANDFRASGSGNKDLDPSQIDLAAVDVAFSVSQRLGFQSMAYDFLRDEDGGLRIIEMSYTFPSRTIHACPGYWDRGLNWHEAQTWPQEAIIDDFLAAAGGRSTSIDADMNLRICEFEAPDRLNLSAVGKAGMPVATP